MIDKYVYVIVTLLPLTALMLVFQVNPYNALVIRAILGAVAALVYAVLGAADVALTEALVGTMLAVTLYVIAVRSSMVMRLGVLTETEKKETYFIELIAGIRKVINKHHLRLELIEYPDQNALKQALMTKEIHAICTQQEQTEQYRSDTTAIDVKPSYQTAIRVRRLFEIMQTELVLPEATLMYVNVPNMEEKH
jgi:putative multicomponent Na+:H+ antiporter subunit B